MKAKLSLLALAVAGVAVGQAAFAAEADPWMVRVRATNVSPANTNSPEVAGAKVALSSKTIPEVDISYFFTPNIAAELILTYPQVHDVTLQGTKIGTLKELPPTFLAQYHFAPKSGFDPYVGVGVNLTFLSEVNLPAGITVKKDSTGLAYQLGADFAIAKNTYLNVDYKYADIKTDVAVAGTKLTTLKVNPGIFSVGIGWRF